jgi:hypothetical protein
VLEKAGNVLEVLEKAGNVLVVLEKDGNVLVVLEKAGNVLVALEKARNVLVVLERARNVLGVLEKPRNVLLVLEKAPFLSFIVFTPGPFPPPQVSFHLTLLTLPFFSGFLHMCICNSVYIYFSSVFPKRQKRGI